MNPPTDLALLLRLRTRQLALLSLLDTERNLGRAAMALNISQPAASKLLQQAEDSFGVALFERQPRGMSPTPHGEIVVRYARSVMADFSAAREELQAISSGLRGTLRIGSVPGAVTELVAPALAEYKRRHPKVAVSITVDTSDLMIHQLARGEVDLVLGRLTEGFNQGDYEIQPLLQEGLVAVTRHDNPLLQRARITFNDLMGAAWILQPHGSPQRLRFDAALGEAGVSKRLNITETASTIATTALLECSDMVAIMPASLARHYARLGVLGVLPLDLPIRVPPIYLIHRQDRPLSSAANSFAVQISGYTP